MRERLEVRIVSPIERYIRVRSVEQVPVSKAANSRVDDNYIKTTAGMYPDLLKDLVDHKAIVQSQKWRSLWIDIETDTTLTAGVYPIRIELVKEGETVCSAETKVEVFDIVLPEQELMHTEWVHTDCLADYYHVEVFSEKHWEIIENFLKTFVKRGGNMILTPLFTSPLDTAVGLERTTIQLVDVKVRQGEYIFGFDKLDRWIRMCKRLGIKYFEMSHLFTQWGANCAPKIVADVDGTEEKIFGWHTPATGEYTRFLHAFLPELKKKLAEHKIDKVTYFHISDEPREQHLASYRAARESLGDLLEGYHTFDALSSLDFYKHGLIDKPVPGNNEIEEFLEYGLTDMWTYYCTGQCYEVSNRFMSMPSARNRIIGTQLYKYDIIGFLHWGYNFYNSEFSIEHINPYAVTDAGGAFPSGDPFLVYPGADGHPEESIRGMVFYEALTDLRALKLLEKLTNKEYVMNMIEENLCEPLTFRTYPKSEIYLLCLRNKINRKICQKYRENQ